MRSLKSSRSKALLQAGDDYLPFKGLALVSVIIPTRNRRGLLKRAIESVANQSYPCWEIIVVDDHSSDGTAAEIEALGDSRIRVERGEVQRGAGYCRNVGAQVSKGAFIAFLDSDDYWLKDKLRIQLEIIEKAGMERAVVMCPPAADNGLEIIPERQSALRPNQRIADYVYAGKQATVLSSCLLVEGEFGRAVRFDPTLNVNQDTDYLLKLESHGARFLCSERALYVLDIRRRGDRMMHNPALRKDSLAWYASVSQQWSAEARRGYFFWDLSVRCAGLGQRRVGLYYFVRGFSGAAGPYRVMRQLLRVIGGGEVPHVVRATRLMLKPAAPRDRLQLPGSF